MSDERELDAGEFSSWISQMQAAIRGERAADVPCGSCTACCTASQFVHIAPDETDTLAHIPAELLFPAPLLPSGHVLLGYDERGHCPMLVDGACSIYEHRPRTCRTYDCRVFPAAGLGLDLDLDPTRGGSEERRDDGKALIAERARQWRFRFPSEADRAHHEATRAAAAFLRSHPEVLPDGITTANPTQIAVLAVEIHELFLGPKSDEDPEPDAVGREIMRRTGKPA